MPSEAGCEKIVTDEISGTKSDRPGLQEVMQFLREGDTLIVWRLDRFGRSLKDLIQKMEALQERGVAFRSLHENIDSTSSIGKFQFHVFGALAEFERELMRERTMAGLRSARARGRKGGRPRSMDEAKIKLASRLMKDPELTVGEICETLGVSSSTLYRFVGPDGELRKSS